MNRIDKMVSRMIDFALEKPEIAPNRVLVINMSKQSLEKILTPSRMDLVRVIKEKKPESVGGLSKLVNRPLESVSRDLKILENYGLLSLTQVGKQKKPKIEKDILMVPLTA
jgi:predicted transcriptional regulator